MAIKLIRGTSGVLQIEIDGTVEYIFNPAVRPVRIKDGRFYVTSQDMVPDNNLGVSSIFSFERTDIDWVNCNPSVTPDPVDDNAAADTLATTFWKDDSGT